MYAILLLIKVYHLQCKTNLKVIKKSCILCTLKPTACSDKYSAQNGLKTKFTFELTRSLREPGGPCTKSMEVSESRIERVKAWHKTFSVIMLYLFRLEKCHTSWSALISTLTTLCLISFSLLYMHDLLKKEQIYNSCTVHYKFWLVICRQTTVHLETTVLSA